MAKISDIKQYKLSKILVNDLTSLLTDYNEIMKAIGIMQSRMKIWGAYKSANHIFHRLEEFKTHLVFERASVNAKLNKHKNIVTAKGEIND